jgi:hypothetical protein
MLKRNRTRRRLCITLVEDKWHRISERAGSTYCDVGMVTEQMRVNGRAMRSRSVTMLLISYVISQTFPITLWW